MSVNFTLNGVPRTLDTQPGQNVMQILNRHGIVSIRNGCDGQGSCGSCSIILDGRTVNSCLLLPEQIEGKEIYTIEFFSKNRVLSVIQSAFVDAGVVQCGYCTPSMVLAAEELLKRTPEPEKQDVRDAFSGIFCRCTGYEQYVLAVELAARRLKDPEYKGVLAPEFREDLRVVGKAKPKVDGPRLVQGQRAFVEDMVQPGSCHLKILRSPHAHARITHIDTSKAESLPGVVLVLTHKNGPEVYYNQAGQGYPEPSPYDRKLFGSKMRHVGDRVAGVVAETEDIAVQALELIEVQYDILEPVLSIEDAEREGAPLVHSGPLEFMVGTPDDLDNSQCDELDGKIIYPFPIHADPSRNLAASVTGGIGDVSEGFAQADEIFENTYETSQIQCTPLEPHVVYTRMEGDRLIIHASTQVPWHVRRIVARVLGIRENRIRVIKERVGGGFGAKQDIVLEEVAAYCTFVTGRPVFFRFNREEEFIASRTRHPMKIKVKLGAKKTGELTAIQMDVKANTGPFGAHCLTVPMNACSKSLPLYLCDHVYFDVKTYYSNIPPAGAYQGYGAPQGAFALQTALAEFASQLNVDLLKMIEMNRVHDGSMLEILRCLGEGREGVPQEVSSCGLGPALEQGANMIRWGVREEHPDPNIKIGKGMTILQQGSGLPGLDSANATVSLLGDGTLMLLSGGADLGTGLDTVTTKMVSESLCTPMNCISLLSADTDTTPYDDGAYASSGTFFSGSAALNAGLGLKEKILGTASEMLGEPVEDLALLYPSKVKGKTKTVTFEDIARYSQSGTGKGQLSHTASFTTDKAAFPYGAHFCQVAVDIQTGKVEIQKYHALQDCGTPINPELALGQMYGGVLKTIGHALFEEMVLDEEGRCLNPDLLGYQVPMFSDVPDDFKAVLIETDDPFGPYGSKSIAEISCNGAAPAIASAIHDAIGVWIRSWPFSAEKILRALGKLP